LQAAYEQFGCNQGNVFFIGIDKGSTNANVIYFDSVYGVQYPGVSGQQGGGNQVHLDYEVQATPTIIVISPDHVIAVKQIYPPTTAKVVDSIVSAGGQLMDCTTGFDEFVQEESFTLFPNPARNLSMINLCLHEGKEIELNVLDAMGAIVRRLQSVFYPEGNHSIPINLEGLRRGIYFVQMKESGEVVETIKLVITN